MNILYYFRGITNFRVKAKKSMKLISHLRGSIPLRNVSPVENDIFEFSCFYGYTDKVKKEISDCGGEILSEKSYGILHLLKRYKKRMGLYISSLLIFVMLFLSQLFVWEIKVEGNEKLNENEIIRTLREIGFEEGVYKKGVDLDSLVNNFLIREKRISWIAVNFDGSVAHVEVREGQNPPIESKKKNVNLIATHDGIVMRADVLEGGKLVEKGDVVHKGQLLVSAFIDRNQKSTLRGARGSVWANTQREICVNVPLEAASKTYTGKTKKVYTLKVLGKQMKFGLYNGKYDLCTLESKNVKAVMSDSLHLPFEVAVKTYREYTIDYETRTSEKALEIAREKSLSMLKESSATFTVASKQENAFTQDGVLVYTCIYDGVENIAKPLEFEIN